MRICYAAATIVLVLVFSFAERAKAATLAVPGQYSTIQAAITAAGNGDTILVAPGTYTQNLDLGGKGIALIGTGGAAVTKISVRGGTAVNMGGNSQLTGFTITGASAAFGAGVAVSGTGQLISNNIFVDNSETSGGYGAAIGGNTASPKIVGNIFTGNSADGQFLSGVVSFINESSPYIANNVFENNPTRAIDLTLPQGTSPIVINNTFVGNNTGVYVDGRVPATSTVIRNNIISGNSIGIQQEFGNTASGPTVDHNLLFANTTEYSGLTDATGSMENLLANPQFVSASDFHLMSTSPAIGAGSNLLAPMTDFDGNSRPPNSIDIGAYQTSVPEPGLLFSAAAGAMVLLLRRSRTGRRRS